MGSLSYDCTPCCHVLHFRGKVGDNNYISRHFEVPLARGRRLFCVVLKSDHKASRASCLDHFRERKLTRTKSVTSFQRLRCSSHAESNVSNVNCDSYVLDGEDDGRSLSDHGQIVPKLLIPGLLDESKGEDAASVRSCFWEYKPKLNVHYEKSGSENVHSPAILFLPGFGVGSFHYKKQLKDLGRDYRAWAIDFLGQGMSLPIEDPTRHSKDLAKIESECGNMWGFGDEAEPWAQELVYSMDLWRDQVRYFVEEVIKEPVYLVGNSLGGYVALYFAACNPQMVKGITLLNATPFWGFLPNPNRSPSLSRLFPWTGTFPLPAGVKKLTAILWQKISDPRSIAEILRQVYADHTTNVDEVFSHIVEITKHPAAAASFASIMFAPRAQLSFKEALVGCQRNNVPICLMYGKQDPWVKPVWGSQVKRRLPDAPYYEISPAGHCPHDEVPEVVNFLLRGWIRSLESQGSVALPLLESSECLNYDMAQDLEFVKGTSRKVTRVQIYGSKSSSWSRLLNSFKSKLREREITYG